MKSKIFITFLLQLAAIINLTAQTPWYLTGNALVGTGTFGSTNSGYDINFVNDNTTAMTLKTSSLWLGIGTISPASLLHLDGSSGGTSEVFRTTVGSSSIGYWKMFRGTTEVCRIWNNNDNDLGLYAPASSGDIIFQTNSSGAPLGRMIIKSGGKVGIGVPSPNKQLEVKDASSAQLRLTQGTSNYTDFTTDGSGNLTIVPIANVGIGSTASSPTATLHVFGNEKINTVNSNTGNFNYLVYNSSTKEIESNNSLGVPSATVCSGTSNLLTKYTGSTSICNSQVYDDGSFVGIGTTSTLGGLLSVSSTTQPGSVVSGKNYGIVSRVTASATGAAIGIIGQSVTGISGTNNYGLIGEAGNAPSGNVNQGVYGNATTSGSTENDGVYGYATNSNINRGTYGQASGSGSSVINYGASGIADGGSSCINIGVYGRAASGAAPTASFAGFFIGDISVNGYTYSSGSTWTTSDSLLKNDIESISDTVALQMVNSLTPSSYYFDTTQFKYMNLPTEKQYGFIAENVKEVLPNLVRTFNVQPADDAGNGTGEIQPVETINYTAIIPVLAAAIQGMSKRIDELESQLNQCCSGQMKMINPGNGNDGNQKTQSVELRNANAIILDQNAPNPFAENTTITYDIPEEYSSAKMIFFDNSGKVIKSVDITERGAGSLMVYASNLSDGMYSYALVVDDKLVDTKKMVKQR